MLYEVITDLKCNCANKLAEKKTLERRITDLKSEVARWEERAELAVTSGKDEP